MSSLVDGLSSYWNELPRDAAPAACQSCLSSFVTGIALAGGRSVSLGLFNGSAAFLCSVIDSLVQPLFAHIFPEQGSFTATLVRKVVVLSVIGLCLSTIAGAIGASLKISVVVSLAISSFLIAFFSLGAENQAEPYLVV